MQGSTELHEKAEVLGEEVVDRHRATVSLMEELEAVDWYQQRAAATNDEELRAILLHNRNEEMEHAAMVLEWMRRHDSEFDEQLRAYLFRDGSIVGHEAAEASEPDTPSAADHEGSLRIGSLRGEVTR